MLKNGRPKRTRKPEPQRSHDRAKQALRAISEGKDTPANWFRVVKVVKTADDLEQLESQVKVPLPGGWKLFVLKMRADLDALAQPLEEDVSK